jgi:DNA-binding SARP family transcriptional activator
VLAALLVDLNHPVSVDQLIDRVWGGCHLPYRPAGAVQTYVAMLRRALTLAGDLTIRRSAGGYLLTAEKEAVDLHRFRGLIGRACASEDDECAAELSGRAMELWRGEPFGKFDSAWFAGIRTTLINERHAALLEYTDVQLRRGRHATLLPDLLDRAEHHPLDERLAGQLMLALCRAAARPRRWTTTSGSGGASPRNWAPIRARYYSDCIDRSSPQTGRSP